MTAMAKILIVENDDNQRLLYRENFEEEGYQVLLAEDGEEACHAVQDNAPDVVILDISMPRVGGLEALARIKEAYSDIPVILFTGFDDDCVRDQRARLAIACVEKSGDLAELKRAIIRALAYDDLGDSIRLGLPD